MLIHDRSTLRNRLLSKLSEEDFALLNEGLTPLDLPKGFILNEPNKIAAYAYFLESGIGSVIAVSAEGQMIEVALFGRDGFAPVGALARTDVSPYRTIIQVAGAGFRIDQRIFLEALDGSKTLALLFQKFAHVMSVQTSFTTLSNAVNLIDERLSRWLLMCHDRSDTNELALTHEFMSIMLSVRRSSVTTSLHILEGNGFIRCDRGYVTIRNRSGLEEFAGDSYGRPEAEYRRLIGPFP